MRTCVPLVVVDTLPIPLALGVLFFGWITFDIFSWYFPTSCSLLLMDLVNRCQASNWSCQFWCCVPSLAKQRHKCSTSTRIHFFDCESFILFWLCLLYSIPYQCKKQWQGLRINILLLNAVIILVSITAWYWYGHTVLLSLSVIIATICSAGWKVETAATSKAVLYSQRMAMGQLAIRVWSIGITTSRQKKYHAMMCWWHQHQQIMAMYHWLLLGNSLSLFFFCIILL